MFSSTALGAGQLGFASKVDADISHRDWGAQRLKKNVGDVQNLKNRAKSQRQTVTLFRKRG
jgi:hypothetical protein